MNFWLLKSDPEEFGWEDLKASRYKATTWDGIRNYQARNFLQKMHQGDQAFFYHSSTRSQTITGIVTVLKEAYPDPTQFDGNSPLFDPKSSPENPTWFMVDIQYREDLPVPVTREEIKEQKALQDMILLKNSRLSVQPVTPHEWKRIIRMSKDKSSKK